MSAARSSARSRMRGLQMPAMEAPCEYSGDSFRVAQARAKAARATLYEHNDRRGEFLVLTAAQERRMWPTGRPDCWSHY